MELNISGLEDVVEVGRGGFATVFRAYQPAFRRTVAVKVLNAANLDELSQERFRRECQAMGLLSEHPSIVTILDAGFLDTGQPFMVMPFMPAGSLGDRVRRDGPLPWAEASKVAVKLAGALHAAHDAGVIHRDVKPANVLVSEYGETKLADFGIARVSGATETQSGVVTASLGYAPPEVIEGKRPTVKSDIYSLGTTVYDLVAGHAPFQVGDESSVAALLQKILNDEPADLVPRGVPGPFAEVISTAMAKNPDDRFDTAAEFGRHVRLAQDELGIKPTELTILKVDTQPPAADTDAEPDAATEAGTHVDDEPETIGVTVSAPRPVAVTAAVRAEDVDDESTRDIPIGLDTASGPPAVDDAADGRRRLLIVGAVVAVVALVVGVVVLRDDGSQSEQSELFRDAPTAKELGITGVEGNVGPIFDDPLVPGPIRDAFDGMPFGTDHTTARAAQCPTGFARDLSGQDLSGVRWMNRDLRCTDFRGANLAGADLSGSITWGSDFTLVDLTDVTFGNFAQFQATVLAGADLSGQSFPDGVDWGYADLTETNLAGSDAYLDDHNSPHSGEWIVLDNTICPDGSNSDITSCESGLAGAGGVAPGYNPPVAVNPLDPPTIGDIGHPNSLIVAFDHESARLSQCPEGLVRDLRDQDLSGVNWTERDLRCTDFRGTELAGADLSGSLMWGSDFTGVDLTEVRFGSDLVQFQATLLVEANLSGQQFVSVDWGWADLTRTDLSGSTADLSGRGPGHGEPVVFDDTICPDGSNSDDNGGQCQG